MKTTFSNLFGYLSLATLAICPSLEAEIRMAPSIEAVAAKRGSGDAVYKKSRNAKTAEPVTVERETKSLLGSCEFLSGARGFTIVPKGAVVMAGSNLQLSVTPPKDGKFLNWSEFHHAHRAYLRILPVTEAQWMGEEPLDPLQETLTQLEKTGMTLATSLKGQLVSLHNLKNTSTTNQS